MSQIVISSDIIVSGFRAYDLVSGTDVLVQAGVTVQSNLDAMRGSVDDLTLTVAGNVTGDVGIWTDGSDNLITVTETGHVSGGLVMRWGPSTLINAGLIEGGAFLNGFSGGSSSLVNTGEMISADGVGAQIGVTGYSGPGAGPGSSMLNQGLISGGTHGLNIGDHASVYVNEGEIRGNTGHGVRMILRSFGAEDEGSTFTNHGWISSTMGWGFFLDSARQVIVNGAEGVMVGALGAFRSASSRATCGPSTVRSCTSWTGTIRASWALI